MKTITVVLAMLFFVGLTISRAQNTWTQKADFGGTGREGAVGFSIGSKGYIGTGYATDGFKKDFWEYDPATDTWTQKADFGGIERTGAVGFSIGSKGYIGIGAGVSLATFLKDFWEYDPEINTWSQRADFGGTARGWGIGFSIDNKGYIGTGYAFGFFYDTYYQDFWEYDPAINIWIQKANFGGGVRGEAVGFSIGDKGYVGTGHYFDENFVEDSYYNDFWQYDPIVNTWTQKANFGGVETFRAVGFSIGSKGYIGTGINNNYSNQNAFWEYDPVTNGWTQKATFAGIERTYAAGFSISGKGYIGTGDLKNDFWEFTPECNGVTVYADADSDGFGDAAQSFFATDCIAPSGYVDDSTDCNDNPANGGTTIHLGVCDPGNGNGVDDNCDGVIDNGYGATTYYADADGDGFGEGSGTSMCSNPGAGYVTIGGDCDDNNATINPVISEIAGDGIDNNCNGIQDENNALNFDGVNDYVNIGNLGIPSVNTRAFWFKPNNVAGSSNQYFMDFGANNYWVQLYDVDGDGKLELRAGAGSVTYVNGIAEFTDAFKWYYVAVTMNSGGTLTIYVNGNYDNSGSVTAGTPGTLALGRYGGGSYYFNGSMDEVRIWNVALTQAEIQDNMNLTICSNTNGLVAYYTFNEGIAGGTNTTIVTADDVAANNNNGTLQSFSLTGAISNWVMGVPQLQVPAEICGDGIDDNCNGVIDEDCGETCAIPTNLITSNITGNSARINWDEVTGAEGYKIRYKISGTSEWTILHSRGEFRLLDNLFPNNSYTWEIKTYCTIAPGSSSDWSTKQKFTTGSLRTGEESVQQLSFQIYPNPAVDQATIQFTLPQSSHVYVKVYDLSGKEIACPELPGETLLNNDIEQGDPVLSAGGHSLQINMDLFAKGVYLVKMISDFGIENQKLIVQ